MKSNATYRGKPSITLTSAIKGLAPTAYDTLKAIIVDGDWDNYAGKIETLGLISAHDPTANYVQLPMDSTPVGQPILQKGYGIFIETMLDAAA